MRIPNLTYTIQKHTKYKLECTFPGIGILSLSRNHGTTDTMLVTIEGMGTWKLEGSIICQSKFHWLMLCDTRMYHFFIHNDACTLTTYEKVPPKKHNARTIKLS